MSELKKPRVRLAKPRDIGLFKKLWRLYLEEQTENGSLLLPVEENVDVFANIFRMYIDPTIPEDAQKDGVVLFISDVAFIMWGDSGDMVKTKLGRTAYLWGVYVKPEYRRKGLSEMLHKEAMKHLLSMGFESLYGTVLSQNETGFKALERGTEKEVHILAESPVYVKIA